MSCSNRMRRIRAIPRSRRETEVMACEMLRSISGFRDLLCDRTSLVVLVVVVVVCWPLAVVDFFRRPDAYRFLT